MSVEIVTYANKSQGMFENLVNNEFGVPIKVLGWGTKWNGYSDKSKGVIKHLETKNDDDVVVFVDGFDTKINRIPDDIIKRFRECQCRVLLSKDSNNFGAFISNLIFGTCNSSGTANAGMYMGYVKELRQLLQNEAELLCQDDQVNLNNLCKKYDFMKVDTQNRIFKNIGPFEKEVETDAIFISYPGTPGTSRYSRAMFEYTQFVYIYVLCLLILSMGVFPKYSNAFFAALITLVTFYILFADKSCTLK
jgi:hypothetical protein